MLRVLNFGRRLIPYAEGLQLQEHLTDLRKLDQVPDTLLLLQHSAVFTVGKRGKETHFVRTREDIMKQGIDIHVSPRGGEVTYHGPGQLVAYPIIALRPLRLGARAYVDALEDAVRSTLASVGLAADAKVAGLTGVWVGGKKVAAIGVKVSHGISSHGLALNVTNDLAPFQLIVPCGMPDHPVTSVECELACSGGGRAANYDNIAHTFSHSLAQSLGHTGVSHAATDCRPDG